MSILAHIYKALPFSKSSRIVATALVSAYHVMLISFQLLLCMQAHLNLFLCVWVWVERLHKDSPTQSTMLILSTWAGWKSCSRQAWLRPVKEAQKWGISRPLWDLHWKAWAGWTARATWGVAIVEQEQHDRSHQLYKSRQWDVQPSMQSAFYSHVFLPGRLSLMKASLS